MWLTSHLVVQNCFSFSKQISKSTHFGPAGLCNRGGNVHALKLSSCRRGKTPPSLFQHTSSPRCCTAFWHIIFIYLPGVITAQCFFFPLVLQTGVCLSLRRANKCHSGPFFSASLCRVAGWRQRCNGGHFTAINILPERREERAAWQMLAEQLLCLKWIRQVFCFARGTECNAPQSARSHSEKWNRGRSVVPSALTTGAETSGRGRQRDAGGWRVLDFRLFFQYEKCSADRLQRIILRTRSNQTAPSCETTWDPTHSSQRLLLPPSSLFAHAYPGNPAECNQPIFLFFLFFFMMELSSQLPACAGHSGEHVWGGTKPVD